MESEDYDDQEAKKQLSDQKQTAWKTSKRTSAETIIKDKKHKASPRKPKHSEDNNTKSKKKKSQENVRQKTQLNITLPNASSSTNDDSRPTSQYSVDDESKGQHSKDSIGRDGSEKDRNADELNTDANENTWESNGKLREYNEQLSKKEKEIDPLETNTDEDSKQDHLNNASNNTDKEQDVYKAESDSNEGVNKEAKGDKCKEEEVTLKPVKETKVISDNNVKTREPENITLYTRDPKSNNNSKKKQATETKNNLLKDESKKGKSDKKKKDKLVTNKNEVLDRKKKKGGESSTELQVSEPKQQNERPKTADVGIQCGTNDPNDEERHQRRNSEEDCIRLHEALCGKKADKELINTLLSTRTMEERLNMVDAYGIRYNKVIKDPVQDVRSELKGDYRDLCAALLQDQATQDAELLNYSIGGLGTNEAALIHILVSCTPQEADDLKERYKELYGHEAEVDLKGDTSGSFKILCLLLLNKEPEDAIQNDDNLAEENARRLWRPGERPTQETDDVLIEILSSCNREQYNDISHIYEKITETQLTNTIKKCTRGDFQEALLAIASFLSDSVEYHADVVYRSLKGFRSNDRLLIHVIVSRVEKDLLEINQVYEQKYHKSVKEAVKSNYSGDFAKLLTQIIDSHTTDPDKQTC